MTSISKNLKFYKNRIPSHVRLIVVSKNQSADHIREAYKAGQHAFGESYVQEALEKQALLRDLNIEWHYIGNIQSNKTKLIAENFDWVQSVNRLSIVEKLNHYRSPLKPLNVCIEVNIDNEETKSGIAKENVFAFAKKIGSLPHLKCRGLMVIPNASNDEQQLLASFQKTTTLFNELKQHGFALDTLSMGMTADFELAIKAGSNMIRIGRGVFGN